MMGINDLRPKSILEPKTSALTDLPCREIHQSASIAYEHES
jgi:hypothetical protein